MYWKSKSLIQNAVSLLPSEFSYSVYYWLQRQFGALRKINPATRLAAGRDTWLLIQKQGKDPVNRVFFEVGTGRVPTAPLAFFLMGAKKTITVDLNPYVVADLTKETVDYIVDNQSQVREIFGALLVEERINQLITFAQTTNFSLSSFLTLCQIEYMAPGDASKTGLPEDFVDFHTSYTVFEHIPPSILKEILKEGNRITRANGLLVHSVDYSDHFSHSDQNISPINFLQFSDSQWSKYGDNRYMYMNRLRHDDFLKIYDSIGHEVLHVAPNISTKCLELLESGDLLVDVRFSRKSIHTLSITASWFVTRRKVRLALP
jgi:SAM-dependent methyltransferase